MEMTVRELIKDTTGMVSLPQVSVRVNDIMSLDDYKASDVGKIIAQDPGLTIRILKVANSPFYGLGTEIETVSRAITILGSQQLRNLVIATSTIKAFEGLPNDLLSMENFWTHSISCALAAKFLAEKIKGMDAETVFTAGLLHDVGQLIIFNKLSNLAHQVILMMEDDPEEPELQVAESQLLGFDHAQVGMELLKQWNLPVLLQECAGFHHDIDAASEYPGEVAVVHLANSIAVMAELNSTEDECPVINDKAWDICQLDKNMIEPTMCAVQEQISEVQNLLM